MCHGLTSTGHCAFWVLLVVVVKLNRQIVLVGHQGGQSLAQIRRIRRQGRAETVVQRAQEGQFITAVAMVAVPVMAVTINAAS